jgi:hypothetical protein
VRHQRTGRNDLVALGGEEVEELLADFGGLFIKLQTPYLFLGQATGHCTLLNACFLIGFALIDARRIGLCSCRQRQHQAESEKSLVDDFHVDLLIPG